MLIHLANAGLRKIEAGITRAGMIRSTEKPISKPGVAGPIGVRSSIMLLMEFGVIRLK